MGLEQEIEQACSGRVKENNILRPLRLLAYQFKPETVFPNKTQYCNVLNQRTGAVETIEGPVRRVLKYDERVLGSIEQKVIVPEHHFVVVENPQTEEGIQYGEREVRIGPQTFSVHFSERVGNICSEYVLTKYDGVSVKALKDIDKEGKSHKAGEEYLILGPGTFIPSKDEVVIARVKGVPLSDTEGIYVQNRDTGDARLVTGKEEETIYFLQPNEQLYKKELTRDEVQALGLMEQVSASGVRVLTRQAANDSYLKDKTKALVLELEDNEIVKIFDGTETRIEQGPKTTFLGPYERPKVLNLSGGKPIEQGALKVALLKLGPDFIYDQITVRTKDNAQLIVDVTYKWRFKVEDQNNGSKEENPRINELKFGKIFTIDDFVGYAAETLSSEIRAAAARHDFEDFHGSALEYAKEAVFGASASRLFEENNLEIFGIDITSITPSDPVIADKLNEAIKENMKIYCNRLVLTAKLDSQKRETEGLTKIEQAKKDLVSAQIENYRFEQTERANVEAEAARINAESSANSLRIVETAKTELEQRRLNTVIAELNNTGGQLYLDLQKATAFSNTRKLVVVPTESKIVLPNLG